MQHTDNQCHYDRSFRNERRRMVAEQIAARGVCDERILSAMMDTPRHEFVPHDLRHLAYTDRALPLESGQTISQPFVVGFMCWLAEPTQFDCVLEVGAGSGYCAAVLSHLCEHVDAVERIPDLVATATSNLHRVGVKNVDVHLADGVMGWRDNAPYDAILVAAAAPSVPHSLTDQLGDGGRLVIPVGESGFGQTMYRITREGEKLYTEEFGSFSFVPLVEGISSE